MFFPKTIFGAYISIEVERDWISPFVGVATILVTVKHYFVFSNVRVCEPLLCLHTNTHIKAV